MIKIGAIVQNAEDSLARMSIPAIDLKNTPFNRIKLIAILLILQPSARIFGAAGLASKMNRSFSLSPLVLLFSLKSATTSRAGAMRKALRRGRSLALLVIADL